MTIPNNSNKTNQLLIEIVGATNLSTLLQKEPTSPTRLSKLNPLSTLNSVSNSISNTVSSSLSAFQNNNSERQSSTTIKVLLNTNKVHKTNIIKCNNNPIWTVNSGSLFLVDIPEEGGDKDQHVQQQQKNNKQSRSRLTFEIRNVNTLSIPGTNTNKRSECIGTVRLNINDIIDKYCNTNTNEEEERVEFTIVKDVYQAAREGILSWNEGSDNDNQLNGEKVNGEAERAFFSGKSKPKEDAYTKEEEDRAILSLRFRYATQEDVTFMNHLNSGRTDLIAQENVGIRLKSSSDIGDISTGEKDKKTKSKQRSSSKTTTTSLMLTEDEQLTGGAVLGNVVDSVMFTLKPTQGKGHKLKLRVKPGPDPSRLPEQTRFLSEEELIAAVYSPSKNWIECGSSSSDNTDNGGRVYVEILHCDNLPNCDAANKTSSFVSIVHDDAAVQTDIIHNCLSPLWMPWTKRSFAFNRKSIQSTMYIGVFHYDAVNPLGHVGIGRVAVNLQQMRSGHIYLLSYTLYTSSVYTNRTPSGTITLRIRIDSGSNERNLLISSIKGQPNIAHQLNFRKKKSLAIVKYTCFGDHLEDKFDLNLLKSEANEMMDMYQSARYATFESLESLIFWRGQVGLAGEAKVPLYSLIAYVFCAYVVERPYLLPSLFFWCTFFVMVASYGHRTHHPSPWHRCRNITDFASILVKGKSFSGSTVIKANIGAQETIKLEAARQSRIELDTVINTKRIEMEQQVSEVEEEAEVNNTASKKKVVPQIDPLAMFIPLQRKIEKIIYYPRLLKSIVTWESSTISFAITAGSLVVALILSVLPTAWLIQWVCRILIHVGLGPHMKVVDAVFNSYTDLEEEGDRLKEQQTMIKKLTREYEGRGKIARLRAEHEMKQTTIRKIRLGPHCVNLPPLNVTRFADYPLPASTATPITSSDCMKGFNERLIVPGQQLHGQMIPVTLNRRVDVAQIQDDKDVSDVKLDGSSTEEVTDEPDELQLLAEYNFQLAQARADLDITVNESRRNEQGDNSITERLKESEKEVERLQNLVEEMTHVSCRDGQLINTSPVNQSMNDEEITLDEHIIPDNTNGGDIGAVTPTIEEENTLTTPHSGTSCIASDSTDDKPATQESEEETKGEENQEEEDDPFSTYNEETRLKSQTPDRSLSSRLFKR